MAKLTIPNEPPIRTTQYERLLGVDYKRDITTVDKAHSPEMVNMISDIGGNPIKRDGYRKVGNYKYEYMITANGEAFGIRYNFNKSSINISKLDIETSTDLNVIWTTTIDGYFGNLNFAFAFQEKIYIICDNGIVKFNINDQTFVYAGIGDGMMSSGTVGASVPNSFDIIPTTVIGLKPDGTGGNVHDDINMMSIYQTMQYGGDGTTKEFKIPNYKVIGGYVKAEILNKDTGEWEETQNFTMQKDSDRVCKSLNGESTITVEVYTAKITFSTAPYAVGSGSAYFDNVRLTFCPFNETVAETLTDGTKVYVGYYKERLVSILKSHAFINYDNRLFIADGARTYYSDVNDPFVISELHWFEVDNTIACYTRSSSYLAIITKDDGKNTVFLAQQTQITTSDSDKSQNVSDYGYSIKASNAGVGAVSGNCLGVLNDEPVFLSNTGLYALLTNYQSEKYAVNRSGKINRRLCKEPNLDTAVGVPWNSYYYIAVNGHMYVLDSRNKESGVNGKSYECYFFDNIPSIHRIFIVNNQMFFTDDTATYRWNNDLPEMARYYDNAVFEDDKWSGIPVKAKWCSSFDDDGHPEKLKTLKKRGTLITLAPHFKSGCEITLIKNGNVFEHIGRINTDLFTFENISFNDATHPFTFISNEVTPDIFTKKKIKKYKRLQIVLENNLPEPFGIINIVKSFSFGNYAKR